MEATSWSNQAGPVGHVQHWPTLLGVAERPCVPDSEKQPGTARKHSHVGDNGGTCWEVHP